MKLLTTEEKHDYRLKYTTGTIVDCGVPYNSVRQIVSYAIDNDVEDVIPTPLKGRNRATNVEAIERLIQYIPHLGSPQFTDFYEKCLASAKKLPEKLVGLDHIKYAASLQELKLSENQDALLGLNDVSYLTGMQQNMVNNYASPQVNQLRRFYPEIGNNTFVSKRIHIPLGNFVNWLERPSNRWRQQSYDKLSQYFTIDNIVAGPVPKQVKADVPSSQARQGEPLEMLGYYLKEMSQNGHKDDPNLIQALKNYDLVVASQNLSEPEKMRDLRVKLSDRTRRLQTMRADYRDSEKELSRVQKALEAFEKAGCAEDLEILPALVTMDDIAERVDLSPNIVRKIPKSATPHAVIGGLTYYSAREIEDMLFESGIEVNISGE